MLGPKANLGKLKKTETISSIYSDHNTKTRNKQGKKTVKKHKHVPGEQYVTEQPIDHWRNQREN